ncbi:MAG TPA: PilZ domain-containing protein [Rhizomicrobium sp.]|nr:PilZ domain-containing protein [Rhizomicrobium sp.]
MPDNSPDRRPASRRRVLLPGLIVYGNGVFTCDCTFRNASGGGARITVAQLPQLPERFYLIAIREGVAYDCRLVWNKGLDIGVKFESRLELSSNNDLTLARLKKLWLAKAPR